MTNPRGGGAFHQYLRMETSERATFPRAVMEHAELLVMEMVPEADRKETLAMLFGPMHPTVAQR